jgi:dihydroorotate dehydrogenase (fumarate)
MAGQTIKLGALTLAAPVFNSAGPLATTLEELQAIADSASGAVATKSFSTEPWPGNPEPNLYLDEHYSINSIGLQNKGVGYFIEAASQLKTDKPLIASLVGKTPGEYLALAQKVEPPQFTALELNLSCPNLESKEPIGFSPAATRDLLRQLLPLTDLPVGVKLPPFLSRQTIQEMAQVLLDLKINHVVLINTYPLAAALEAGGAPVIAPGGGVGGLGGPALKPIALAHVMLMHQFTDGRLPIVGVGGVQTPAGVKDYLAAGATAVQVGTATITHGLGLFEMLNRL